jgi:hypothetical protein
LEVWWLAGMKYWAEGVIVMVICLAGIFGEWPAGMLLITFPWDQISQHNPLVEDGNAKEGFTFG